MGCNYTNWSSPRKRRYREEGLLRIELKNLQDQLEEKQKASQGAADPEEPDPSAFKKPFPKTSPSDAATPAPARKKGPIGASTAFNPVRIVLKKNSAGTAPIGSSQAKGVTATPPPLAEEQQKPPSWEVGREPAASLKSAHEAFIFSHV